MSKFQIVKGITDNLEDTPYVEGKVYFTYEDTESEDISIYADIDGVRRKIKGGVQREEINDFNKIYIGTSDNGWWLTDTQLSTSIPWVELKKYIQYSSDSNAGLVLRYINTLEGVYSRTTFYLFHTNYNPYAYDGSIYYISGIGEMNGGLVFISFLIDTKTNSINDNDPVTFTLTPIIDDIPTNVSDLNNDSGFQTSTQVNSAIATAIGNINQFNVAIVSTLPTENIDTHTIYFMSNGGSDDNIYDEWMYINNNWEKIGTTAVDLSGYMQTSHPANGITSTDINNWNAKSDTDEKLKVTATDVSGGYYPILSTNVTTAETKKYDEYFNFSRVNSKEAYLGIGKLNTALGKIRLYTAASGGKYGTITPGALSDTRTYTLPDKSGTVALTSDIPIIPTTVSSFTNDSGYLTLADLPIYDGMVV